uniref:Fas-binding factor 1 C-terminal domain-containing protein n=1 Tax=Sparus aurata TaxID=8175 RepID=A0A671YPL4_SPAAU
MYYKATSFSTWHVLFFVLSSLCTFMLKWPTLPDFFCILTQHIFSPSPFIFVVCNLISEAPMRARTRLDEILESLTSPRLLERPPTGERKDQPQSLEKQQQEKTPAVKDSFLEDDLTFGSYQPTLVSTPEGRQSRRQSVRFSTEDVSSPEKKPKPSTLRHRNSADWLGLKTDDDQTFLDFDARETKPATESPKTPSSPASERRPSLTPSHATSAAKMAADTRAPTDNITKQTKPEVSKSQKKEEEEEEEDDWLSKVLSKKKSGDEVVKCKIITFCSSYTDSIPAFLSTPPQSHSVASKHTPTTQPYLPSTSTPSSPASLHAKVDLEQTPGSFHPSDNPPQASGHLPVSAASITHTQPQPQSQPHHLPSERGSKVLREPGQASDETSQQLPLLNPVRTLQLERDQSQMLLENVQQRHKQDMEIMENAHKARVKLLEESAAQRETQTRQECEDLMERLAAVTRSAEQERSELQAQYQRKLAQTQQDRDREVERLRDLQRKSILEMKKDHEDQVKRLKKLKDEEIDAVTSATSQTRSLTVVIEQMEQFTSRLGELSSRVESTHDHTAHGLEQGARHRDEQHRVMQDRLAQQQKAMAEERAYLKEIISKMDIQLSEQQRQLEKERWKMTAEQAKAESTQRGLEEERRALSMQINIEREELERAKVNALLEEQKTVMQHCAEERRKLAADWAHFHAMEKQRHERAEREVSSLLEKREGSIISLAQEQADLKLHTAELKQKEMAVKQERETLERLREELDREKERISSTALRLKTRAQEVEAFSKLAAEKHEEGERALQEAKRTEAEHAARLANIHTQIERLRQQEQRILQERMRLSHLQKETERLRQDGPISSLAQMIPPILSGQVNCGYSKSNTFIVNMQLNSFCQKMPNIILFPFLITLFSCTQDREYLQEEQIFLDNLKKKSYRSSFNTD